MAYKVDLLSVPNRYGFGRDWTLKVSRGSKSRSFWLGQDAKVTSRILGMDMRDAVDYYSKKANSKDFDKVRKFIAEDILATILYNDSERDIADADVDKLLKDAQDWSLAVE